MVAPTMVAADPVAALCAASHTFGARAAQRKRQLLRRVAGTKHLDDDQLVRLQEALNFMRAYPDDAAVLRLVRDTVAHLRARLQRLEPRRRERLVNSGLPGSRHAYPYHWGVLRQMVQAFPGCLEIDWESVEDEGSLIDALRLSSSADEVDGLEDERLSLEQWFELSRPAGLTQLETLLERLGQSGHAEPVQAKLFDAGDVPIGYRLDREGSARCEVELPVHRRCYQKRAIARERFPIAKAIREPLEVPPPCPPAEGRAIVRAAHAALCSRNLEIYPLIYANPADVTRVPCGRGLEVVLVGIRPAFRAALETITFYLIAKNGVPIAYGPAGVFLGACEMGINLFPEFRGAEIWFVYAQLMRVLRHALGVEYYYLLRYGMGEGNPEAIQSGAFWFYRKLGFVPDNPRVEALAQREEERMRSEPGHRSSPAMLRRLSHTSVSFDLSGGRCEPFDFGALGLAISRFVGQRYEGDRARAERACARHVARALGAPGQQRWTPAERESFSAMAPLLGMMDALPRWSRRDRALLLGAIRAKGRVPQAAAARAWAAHPRLGAELRRLARRGLTPQPGVESVP